MEFCLPEAVSGSMGYRLSRPDTHPLMLSFLNPTAIISILIALSVHEWAHAYSAYKLGDPTARDQGRLTLNPIAHLDFLGTIFFLLVGFGWGKPVPVNPAYFQNPKRDNAIVAFAGPLSNLLLGTFFYALFTYLPSGGSVGVIFLRDLASVSVLINLSLMAFNLLPIAPLDGSKVIHPFVPLRREAEYEQFLRRGPVILLILLVVEQLFNVGILSRWIDWIFGLTMMALSAIFG